MPTIIAPGRASACLARPSGRRPPVEQRHARLPVGRRARTARWRTIITIIATVSATPSQVGSYPLGASPYGALDMAGNVWEWVNDWYQSNYYSVSPPGNPPGPASGAYKVAARRQLVRLLAHLASGFSRYDVTPDIRTKVIGFRCAALGP